MSELPLDGIMIEVRVKTKYGWQTRLTVTPIKDDKSVFKHTLDVFGDSLWRDIKHLEASNEIPNRN